jgi:hypothetical protein
MTNPINTHNEYPLIPRSLDSAGSGKFGVFTPRNSIGRYGMRSTQQFRNKQIHKVELSWEGVPANHLASLEELIHAEAGVVVCPTFATVGFTEGIPYKGGSRLTLPWNGSSFSDATVDDVSSFSEWNITITVGVNDKITFKYKTSAGVITEKTGTLTPGTYKPWQLEEVVDSAMNDAIDHVANPDDPSINTWYLPYDDRFVIYEVENGKEQNFLELPWFSSSTVGQQVGSTLGYDVSRDLAGATEYYSDYFLSPYGHRVIVTDMVYTTLAMVNDIDVENKAIELVYYGITNTFAAGAIVEPVFNAEIILPESESGLEWGMEWVKSRKGIVNASCTFREVLNA